MTAQRPVVMAALAAAALLSCLDLAGAWWWRSTARILSHQPEEGARRLAEMPFLALPEAVRRSRRLVERDLAAASPELVVRGLERLGSLQRAWFHADPLGFRNAASAALIDGRLPDASARLDEALRRDPTSAVLYRLRALVRWAEGRHAGALDDLAEASALAPGLRTPRLEVAPEDAAWVRAEGLERALDRYPRQRVRTLLALADQLRSEDLEDQGRTLLEDEPYNPEIELTLAAWDRDAGRLDEAAARLTVLAERRLIPTAPRARAWSELATVRALGGDLEGAEAAARTALALAPGSTAPYVALAQLAERRGQWTEALNHLRKAWGLAPADPRMLVRVAGAAERAGDVADARLALERAAELEPDVPEHAVRLIDFHIRNGQYLEATLRLSRALERFPTEPRLLRQLERLQKEAQR